MNKLENQITWSRPNEVLEIVNEYDWSEKVLGTDEAGNNYEGIALISLDEIEDIIDIEKMT